MIGYLPVIVALLASFPIYDRLRSHLTGIPLELVTGVAAVLAGVAAGVVLSL